MREAFFFLIPAAIFMLFENVISLKYGKIVGMTNSDRQNHPKKFWITIIITTVFALLFIAIPASKYILNNPR